MTISDKLDPLVGLNDDGSERFFKHVSARAGYELGLGHPCGMRTCTDERSSRPGTHTDIFADFYVDERAITFNAYDGNPANMKMFLADDKILLGSFPSCAQIGCINVSRSGPDSNLNQWHGMGDQAPLFELDADGKPTEVIKKVNDCLNTADDGAWAEFPVFDLYLTHLSKPCNPADPLSYPTICLVAQADMADPKSAQYDITTAGLQMTGSCEDWIMWMKLSADAPEHSGVAINGNKLVAGK